MGAVGLKNLGNTCFMNSAIQCLSHSEDLTKYFLLNKFAEEINKINKHGSGGQIARAYSDLIKELWSGQNSSLSPWDFKKIFGTFFKQFSGYSQHDSQEMLAFLLDSLHEDLNRVQEKPYCELNEKMNNESESQASNRWWQNHLKRENSIIVDLFHGQYKSIITCPDCTKISMTYDPFMFLGLPIPSSSCRVKFKCFFLNDPNSYIEHMINVSDHTCVSDLKSIIKEKYKNSEKKLVAFKIKNFVVMRVLTDNFYVKPIYESDQEIIIYELENDPDSFKGNIFYVIPAETKIESSMLIFKSEVIEPFGYSKPFEFEKGKTINDLYIEIFKYYRKVLEDFPDHEYSEFAEKNGNRDFLLNEFNFYVTKKQLLKLHIVNNIPDSDSFFSSKQNCEFCSKNCKYCSFPCSNTPLAKVYDSLKCVRKIILYAQIVKRHKIRNILTTQPQNSNLIEIKKGSANIYDCFDNFQLEEKLEKENAWYCSNCKNHKEALKKLEIFKPPKILIIQLKRFKIKSTNSVMGMLTNKKNDAVIDFPVTGLDLTQYVVGPERENNPIYDLYAVSQHFGGLSSGHYTAVALNNGRWLEFDDSSVSKASTSDIVSGSAYILFYSRR
jgi:ubiquitin carboxyl-terminal hydrolase 4/11/15